MAKTKHDKKVVSRIANVSNFLLLFITLSVIAGIFVVHESNLKTSFLFSTGHLKPHLYSNFDRISANLKACDERFLNYSRTMSKLNNTDKLKREKRLPDIIGIGAEKCGTGFLKRMLESHPMIVTARDEAHFFERMNYEKGLLDFYRNMMPDVTKYELSFEKSPAYFNFDLLVPQKIRRDVPNAKLILVLCDPVNRTISAFVQEGRFGFIPKHMSFDSFITSEMTKIHSSVERYTNNSEAMRQYLHNLGSIKSTSRILTTGMYYYHLKNWLKSYNLSDIHIINGEVLLTDPGSLMEEIQEFLGIPKFVIKEDFKKGPKSFYGIEKRKIETRNNVSFVVKLPAFFFNAKSKGRTRNGRWGKHPMDETIRKLREFYEPFNQKLYKLLGRNLHWQKPERNHLL